MNALKSGGICEEDRSTRSPFFAHELLNHLATALLAVEVMKTGHAGTTERSLGTLERSLRALREMIDRSMSEARG